MSALQLDEFSLEMRTHYITTALGSLDHFKTLGDFRGEFMDVVEEWISEGLSNKMDHFATLLTELKGKTGDMPTVPAVLGAYLEVLKDEEDSAGLLETFRAKLNVPAEDYTQLYLQCQTGSQEFILPVKNVIEIVGNKKVYPLPAKQMGIKGLMNFRGQGIPVVDLTEFGFTGDLSKDLKTFYVVCEHNESYFSIEVHQTNDVLEVQSSQLQPVQGGSALSPVVDHFVIQDKKTLMLLDIEKLVKHE